MTKLIWALCVALAFPVATQGQQPAEVLSEYEVVTRLKSRDFGQMSEAMGAVRLNDTDTGFSPWRLADGTEVGASVRTALIEALDYHLAQYGAWTDGKPYNASYVDNIPDGWGADLTVLVVALKDDVAIPVLLLATGYGWGPINALLDFGPMVVTPAIECAENDAIWTDAVSGCMLLLTTAVHLWQNQLNSSEMERLQALVRKHLSKPLADYKREYTGVRYAYGASDLALALGWTEELSTLAHSRLQEIDPEQHGWQYEDILKSLSGEIASVSVAKLIHSARQ